MSYWRFAAMIATSTVIMLLLMYLNTYALDHVFYSETRAWMALVMGAMMAIVMMGFMWSSYGNRTLNIAILGLAALVFAGALWVVRSQETVDDVAYMKAMIPHHSIAVLTSSRAHIRDPRVRDLADEILEAQVREIAEMKRLIAELERRPVPAGAPDLQPRVATR
jgi:peptidoglycan/LPS O-acetylase OafA/YrhL